VAYLVTGGTGFLGKRLVARLIERAQASTDGQDDIYLLTMGAPYDNFDALLARWGDPDCVHFVRGNITQPQLGMSDEDVDRLRGKIDHFFHLAAIYDMRASEQTNIEANVGGTRHMLALAKDLQARRLHLTSSVAIAGNYEGFFREDMFDEGQYLPTPYHRTKWESERLVRTESEVPWRVYRPGIVVGDSRTGEMDKIDGPYYFFKAIQRIGHYLPEWVPLAGPELGWTNVVPVDFVTSALDHIAHQPDLDYRAFHLTDPKGIRVGESLNIFAQAAHAPQMGLRVDKRILDMIPKGLFSMLLQIPALKYVRRDILADLGIPESVLENIELKPRFDTRDAEAALAGSGIGVPPLASYAGLLYDYWQRHLDPELFKDRSLAGAVGGKTVLITGGSSGIGKTTAVKIAEAGGVPLLVARTESKLREVQKEIEAAGGTAKIYPTDLTSLEAIDDLVQRVLADNAKVDFLVNNAGRSIRRGIMHSLDRFDGYERTMQLNYFGTIRLIMGLIPHWRSTGGGHIVNVSSIGVQTNPPRFSAYVASKAALDGFTDCVSSELVHHKITFSTIHMPLVRTPMIGPTKIYDAFPALTPDEAAELVATAIRTKPKEINTRVGTFGAAVGALAPKLKDQILNMAYKVFPDSTASKSAEAGQETQPSNEAKALAHLMKGVYW
jgi:NAD(P)-dependent dehydrogenase (short-subunit alcohol dehydrogenase family)